VPGVAPGVFSRSRGQHHSVYRGRGISLFGLIYLIAGVIVAATHDYFERLSTVRLILSAVLAVLLWPLILLGIDLHIKK
jgi:membrane associated rhomboid family serine protease